VGTCHPSPSHPANPVPGVNGLKLRDGALFYSNTQTSTLHRISLDADRRPAGEPALVAAPVNFDDFAFGPDGAPYGTIHVFNNVIRIAPAAGRVAVAFETDVLGSTAADTATLYVLGNGGLTLPPPDGVQPATVTALRIDQAP
jgi:hypothetical protein